MIARRGVLTNDAVLAAVSAALVFTVSGLLQLHTFGFCIAETQGESQLEYVQ